MIRRRLYWYYCIKSKGKFSSYNAYKQSWDSNINVKNEIKKELVLYINDKKHKINVQKQTLEWLFNPSSRGNRRR
jgi:hypothetical protein